MILSRYNTKDSLLYLASRFVPDYAALIQIFKEIKKKDENFQPKYLFDFASGTGFGFICLYFWNVLFFKNPFSCLELSCGLLKKFGKKKLKNISITTHRHKSTKYLN